MKLSRFIPLSFLIFLAANVQAKEIRFAMEATYPPFEFTNDKNEVVGFDVDLAKALCQVLETKCSFHIQSFDSLIASLKFRRFDAAISGMDITPEREKQVLFSQPYYENSAVFVVPKGKFSSVEQLAKYRIGIQNGSTHQKYIFDNFPKQATSPYGSIQHAFIDLENDRVDAVFGDSAVIDGWLKTTDKYERIGQPITDVQYFGRGYGIAVNLQNTALRDQLNHALKQIKADGTYQKIHQRWFSADKSGNNNVSDKAI